MKLVYEGREYDAPELESLTFREQGIVNRISELAGPLEWERAFDAGNPLMILALLMIAMRRSGVAYNENELLDQRAISIEVVAEEAEVSPPAADPEPAVVSE